ncbi:MAG: hypothetical protein ACRC3G_08210 [Bacteroidales bacterium]
MTVVEQGVAKARKASALQKWKFISIFAPRIMPSQESIQAVTDYNYKI